MVFIDLCLDREVCRKKDFYFIVVLVVSTFAVHLAEIFFFFLFGLVWF